MRVATALVACLLSLLAPSVMGLAKLADAAALRELYEATGGQSGQDKGQDAGQELIFRRIHY